jgi:hypothetical protein
MAMQGFILPESLRVASTSFSWFKVIQVVAGSIVYTWVYNSNRHSTLSAVVVIVWELRTTAKAS